MNPTPTARIRGVVALLRTGRSTMATWPSFVARSACRRTATGNPSKGSIRTRRGSTPAPLAGVQRLFLEHRPRDGNSFVELAEVFEGAGLSSTWRHDGLDGTAGLGLAIFSRG